MAKRSVLVVDDASVMRRLLHEVLRLLPEVQTVELCATVASALQALPRCQPDIIILDLEMPGQDGFAALPEFRRRLPSVPVIMLSSAASLRPEVAVRALDLGAAAFIEKPSRVRHLQESINQLAGQFRTLFAHLAVPQFGTAPLRVLVVDDSRLNRHILGRLLAQLGHDWTEAGDAFSAEAAWTDAPFAAVLMDSTLPGRDGVEATRRLRAFEQARCRPPARVIAITSTEGDESDRRFRREAGMDDYLPRPFTLEALDRVLRGHHPQPLPQVA